MTKVQRQYGHDLREPMEELGRLAPLPRYLYAQEFNPSQAGANEALADEIREQYMMRRMQMSARTIMDMRLMRFFDPEKLQDQWQNVWTGEPLRRLSRSRGRAIEIYNWSAAVGESLVGMLAGRKPFAYQIDVPPLDPESTPDAVQADAIEQWLYWQRYQQRYSLTYTDAMSWTMMLGRNVKMVSTDPDTREITTQLLWPANACCFWQDDLRTLEQVIISRAMTLGQAVARYPEKADEIIASLQPPDSTTGSFTGMQNTSRLVASKQAHVTMLQNFYRLGSGPRGQKVGMNTVLLYTKPGKRGENTDGTLMLDRDDDTGLEDLNVYVTPRFRIPDKTPDEATGALMHVAPLNTEFNEVFSSARDMVNRAIYPRFKARGFSWRNAPRFIRDTAMYALPRNDQDIARIDELLNTVPVEQVLQRLEDMIMVFPGLNRYFLGSAPPSETSGDAIDASLAASTSRLESTRTEVQEGEIWTHLQWMSQGERWGEWDLDGRKIRVKDLIEGYRVLNFFWGDAIEIGKVHRQQMALAGRNAGVLSDDTVMDLFGVRSKVDEQRKIRRAYQDPVIHPERVQQTAAAMIQLAGARRMASGGSGQPPHVRVNLTGMLPPPAVDALLSETGLTGQGQSQQMPPGEQAGPTQPPAGPTPLAIAAARANEAAQTSAARAAPPNTPADNSPGGAAPPTAPGDYAGTGRPAGR